MTHPVATVKTADYADYSCQNDGINSTRMVKISKRPTSMAKLISQVEKSLST